MESRLGAGKLVCANLDLFNEPPATMQCQLVQLVEAELNRIRKVGSKQNQTFSKTFSKYERSRERLYPQNVVGAILVPIFLWSIGAAGEKAEYVGKMAKVWLNLGYQVRDTAVRGNQQIHSTHPSERLKKAPKIVSYYQYKVFL